MAKKRKKKTANRDAGRELVGLREFARRRGVSATAVSKAIATGRIRSASKVGRTWRIDVERANAEWDANSNPAKQRPPETSVPRRHRQAGLFGEDEDEGPPLAPGQGDGPLGPNMQRSQAIKLACQAQLARLEFEEKAGRLVRKDQVTLEAFRLYRGLRDALLRIPDRLSAELAAATEESLVHERLRLEIVDALEELRRVAVSD